MHLTNTKQNVDKDQIVGSLDDGTSIIISLSELLDILAANPEHFEGGI